MIYDDDGLRMRERDEREGVTLRRWLRWHGGEILIAVFVLIFAVGVVAA